MHLIGLQTPKRLDEQLEPGPLAGESHIDLSILPNEPPEKCDNVALFRADQGRILPWHPTSRYPSCRLERVQGRAAITRPRASHHTSICTRTPGLYGCIIIQRRRWAGSVSEVGTGLRSDARPNAAGSLPTNTELSPCGRDAAAWVSGSPAMAVGPISSGKRPRCRPPTTIIVSCPPAPKTRELHLLLLFVLAEPNFRGHPRLAVPPCLSPVRGPSVASCAALVPRQSP